MITETRQETPNPRPEPEARRSLIPGWRTVLPVILVFTVIAAASVAWLLGLFTPEPEAVSLDATVAAATATDDPESDYTSSDNATSDDASTDNSGTSDDNAAVTDGAAGATISGQWSVAANDATFAGYRADGNTGEAVGRTSQVTGSLTADGDQVTSVEITVDMTTLESDSSLRDDHLGDEGIAYNTYPTAAFVLTEAIDLPADATEGTQFAFTAVGDLTVRDTTQPVSVDLEAVLLGDELIVVGSTELSLADFGAGVGSTDAAIMEFSLVFIA